MNYHGQWRRRVAPMPLKALYTISELASASGLCRKRLLRLFDRIGLQTMRSGSLVLVPLSELEEKAWPFWESIQTAEAMRHRETR